MFQTKVDSYEDISWASVWSCGSLWVSKKSQFLRRHILDLSLRLRNFMSFKPKWILLKTFFESQFEVIYVYEFQTKANSYEDICLVSFWSDVSLWIWNQSEFSWTHLLSLSLKLFKFMSFKQNRTLMKTFLGIQFEVMEVYGFQRRANPDDDIFWVSVWRSVSFWVSNKSEFSRRYSLSLSLKWWKFMSFKQKRILRKT